MRCFQDVSRIERVPMSTLPIICFRDGGPPLPDALNITLKDSAISGRIQGCTSAGHVFMLDTTQTIIVLL
jgi:hypothetical protein